MVSVYFKDLISKQDLPYTVYKSSLNIIPSFQVIFEFSHPPKKQALDVQNHEIPFWSVFNALGGVTFPFIPMRATQITLTSKCNKHIKKIIVLLLACHLELFLKLSQEKVWSLLLDYVKNINSCQSIRQDHVFGLNLARGRNDT